MGSVQGAYGADLAGHKTIRAEPVPQGISSVRARAASIAEVPTTVCMDAEEWIVFREHFIFLDENRICH